jgi:pyridoxal phosphate-dependent aminotransferase EpsN
LARRKIFERYRAALSPLQGIQFMPELANSRSTRWLTALTIDPLQTKVSPKEIIEALAENEVEARHVWKPMHLQPLFQTHEYFPHSLDMSCSDQLFHRGLCLPSSSNLTEEDQDRIIRTILTCWS